MNAKTIKNPYTTEEFFDKLMSFVKENSKATINEEYCIGHFTDRVLDTYEFDVVSEIVFGSNEGTYLQVLIRFRTGEVVFIGAVKTLDEDVDAFRQLGILSGEIAYYSRKFVNQNLNDFTWEGYRIEDSGFAVEVRSPERALERFDRMSKTGNPKIYDLSTWDNKEITRKQLQNRI